MTKQYIKENLLTKTGSFNTKKALSLGLTADEAYMISNDISTVPLCECGEKLKFFSHSKGYSLTCGKKECVRNKKNNTLSETMDIDITKEYIEENLLGKDNYFNFRIANKLNITELECWIIVNGELPKCTCGKEYKFLSFRHGTKCECISCHIELNEDYVINNLLNQEGLFLHKRAMTLFGLTEKEIFDKTKECTSKCTCSNKRFRNYKIGYICDSCDRIEIKESDVTKEFVLSMSNKNGTISGSKLKKYKISKSIYKKIYMIMNNIDKDPKCEICGNKTDFNSMKRGFFETCGKECRQIKQYKEFVKNIYKNTDDLTESFIRDKFICDGMFKLEEMTNYFDMGYQSVMGYKNKFNITEENIPLESSKNATERVLQKLIKYSGINNKRVISPKELDVYSEQYNFAVEYDGLICHSYGKSDHSMFNNTKIDQNIHLNKTLLCEEKDIQLFRIWENEWLDKTKKQIWISMLRSKQGLSHNIGARKCYIKEISVKEAKEFLIDNHMQGYTAASIKLGLFYNDILVQVMTFGKPRMSKKYEWELIRFATKKHLNIQGGGSKLLKHFEREYKPKSLLSYANRRWSQGNFYIKSGFEFSHDTSPNYFYFNKDNILYSRNRFMKHKLPKLLENFDSSLSETENMFNNGYRKIYDCGNKVYVKTY